MDPRVKPAGDSQASFNSINSDRGSLMPKVLISDALSPAAVQIFKDRGIEVDFQPNLGKDKEKLAEIGTVDIACVPVGGALTAKYERAKWVVRGTGRWVTYDYPVQLVSPIDPSLRTRDELELELPPAAWPEFVERHSWPRD